MKPPVPEPGKACHQCASENLRIASEYAVIKRVTSDCKPWPAGGLLALCQQCGLVQTIADSQWQMECKAIYHAYTIYHQSGGIEQPVFAADSGVAQGRSSAILDSLQKNRPLPGSGRWLDVGCGNGAMLRTCSASLPDWSLCGSDVSDKYQSIVESIPQVERLFTCAVSEIPGDFDVISLIHVLEHIPKPRGFLEMLATKLRPDGILLVEAPDCQSNCFMLSVADHCSHFSTGTLAASMISAGCEVLHATTAWVPKEITVVGRRNVVSVNRTQSLPPWQESERVFAGVKALQKILGQVEGLRGSVEWGILGTSIAATWLQAQTGGAAAFFVDENPNCVGRHHIGKPVISVRDIPAGAALFVALPPPLAIPVAARLKAARPEVRFVTP